MLCNKGARKITEQADNTRHEEAETPASILARHKAPQVFCASYSTGHRSTHRDQHHHTCRCRLGRMPNNTTKHNRLLHLPTRNMRALRQQNTGNSGTQQCRERTLRHWNRCNRITTPGSLPQRDIWQQHQNHTANLHRLLSREVNCNKNRELEKGKTHRAQIPLHTTTSAIEHPTNLQNQNR